MDFGRFLEQWTVSTVFPPLWNALAAEKEQRNTAEMEFVKEVLVDVNERMVRLEKLVDEEYMKTEDFRNFLHKMLLKAALDLRREKKKLFANVIVNATLREFADVNDKWKYLYGETNADYLMSTGLMTRIHQMRYDGAQSSITPQDEYYVTEFGTGFIDFVRERESVEFDEGEEV
jgi:hypothetical protein